MVISEKAKKELREIYRKEFNEDISDEEAEEIGMRLLRIFQLLGKDKESPLDALEK